MDSDFKEINWTGSIHQTTGGLAARIVRIMGPSAERLLAPGEKNLYPVKSSLCEIFTTLTKGSEQLQSPYQEIKTNLTGADNPVNPV